MTGRAGKNCKFEQRRELLGKSPEGKKDYKGRSPEEGKGLASALGTRPAEKAGGFFGRL